MDRELVERIWATRKLNEEARSNPGIACRANIAIGIQSLSEDDRTGAMAQIIAFTNFTGENDPHGEQDFGAVYKLESGEWTQERPNEDRDILQTVFWKIDYYDHALEFGSEAPWDATKTTRVMTIMLSNEY